MSNYQDNNPVELRKEQFLQKFLTLLEHAESLFDF